MTDAANPLDNKREIEGTKQLVSFIITNLLQPAVRQSAANAEAIAATNQAIAAEGEQVRQLRESVEILRTSTDDTASESVELERDSRRQDASITALREDAAEDRRVFREQAEADRQVFREALEADRTEWRTRLDEQGARLDRALDELAAQRESMRALLSALATTNGRVDDLEAAS